MMCGTMRRIRGAGLFLLVFGVAASSHAARFEWEMDATEDQVNNCPGDPPSVSCEPDGSTNSTATGGSRIVYDSATDELRVEVDWNDLEHPLTAIHLHGPATPDISVMPHLFNVYTGVDDVIAAGVDRTTDAIAIDTTLEQIMFDSAVFFTVPEVVNAMVRDLGYVNIHSTGWPRGELRANLVLVASSQTKDQQKCTNAMNKGLRKVAKAASVELCKCIKDHNKSKGVTDIAACLDEDRKGKIAKAASKTGQDETKKCEGVDKQGIPKRPRWGVTDAATVNGAALAKETALINVIYGSDVAANAVTEAEDKPTAQCQEKVAKRLKKCQDTKLNEFNKCKKFALKEGKEPFAEGAMGPEDLATCIFDDPKGKIAKACDEKLTNELQKCIDKGADLADAFPDCGSSDVGTVRDCLEHPVECLTCQAINTADGLAADCDAVDNGVVDGSCP